MIANSLINSVLYCSLILSCTKVFITLVSILVTLDRSFVSSWIIYFIVSDGLWAIHGLVKHHKLHLLLLNHFLLHRVHAILVVEAILSLILGFVHIATHSHSLLVFVLNEVSSLCIFEVTLLLIGFDSDVSIDTVEVFFFVRQTFFKSNYLF